MVLSRSRRRATAASMATLALLTAAAGTLTTAAAPAEAEAASRKGPCDIYAAGGTPCVAAHSTTRALYRKFDGALYEVRRASDGRTTKIRVTTRGGFADAKKQDAFCKATSCVITVIYDQSGRGNHLTQAPPGGFDGPAPGGYDNLADASRAPVTLDGHKAYGVYVAPGTGYRNNKTDGVATGDDPEGMYAVLDGTHYNDACCFDYGNAETDSFDDGNGTMEAIYFGTSTGWGRGTGSGPWIMADLENGLFSGVHAGLNNNSPSISDRFVTAMVKGAADQWAIRGGNAQTGALSTYYHGARPNESPGYNPMAKQGAIILGIGGDNSNGAAGTFYEGVMTSGYPSEETENAVQANITKMRYKAEPTPLQDGPKVSLRSPAGQSATYVAHDTDDDLVSQTAVSASSPAALKRTASFVETKGLADPSCVSFEAVDRPGSFLRHQNFQLHVQPSDGGALFSADATFCPVDGNSGSGTSFRSSNFPTRFLRAYQGKLYIASDGGDNPWDASASWATDSSFDVTKAWKKR